MGSEPQQPFGLYLSHRLAGPRPGRRVAYVATVTGFGKGKIGPKPLIVCGFPGSIPRLPRSGPALEPLGRAGSCPGRRAPSGHLRRQGGELLLVVLVHAGRDTVAGELGGEQV